MAATFGIAATAQAWTAGTNDGGNLVLKNDVATDNPYFTIGFIGGVYEIGGLTENPHVFGNCTVTSEPNVVHCSPTGIAHVVYTDEVDTADSLHFDFAWDLTKAPLPDGVSTRVNTHAGNDGVIGSHNRDVIDGGAGKDFIQAWHGGDKITGGSGKDDLYGAEGRDLLIAQDGTADGTINCGPGNDQPALFDVGLDPAPVDCG